MTQDPLNPSKLLQVINDSADILPLPLDALAAFSHACMLAVGFRFLGFGEDHKTGNIWICGLT